MAKTFSHCLDSLQVRRQARLSRLFFGYYCGLASSHFMSSLAIQATQIFSELQTTPIRLLQRLLQSKSQTSALGDIRSQAPPTQISQQNHGCRRGLLQQMPVHSHSPALTSPFLCCFGAGAGHWFVARV